jgi:hypothetical protein
MLWGVLRRGDELIGWLKSKDFSFMPFRSDRSNGEVEVALRAQVSQ